MISAYIKNIPNRISYSIHVMVFFITYRVQICFITNKSRVLLISRSIGKIYVASILVIGAPTGLYMAFFANGGAYASFGFIIMSILWFYTTWMGLITIIKKQILQHQQWMIRSYAVTFSAVTLRLWVPFLSIACNWEHEEVVVITAWISWLFNLIAAELIIYFTKFKTKTI